MAPAHSGAAEIKAVDVVIEADDLWSLVGDKSDVCWVRATLDADTRPVAVVVAGDWSGDTARRL